MNGNQRNNKIRHSRPFDAAHRHVDGATCGDDLFETVFTNVAVFDRVGGDECGEAVRTEQGEDAAEEIGDKIAQTGGGILPAHIFAEGMAVGAA